MQAPKQELFMLNWEIFDLNSKLKTFANVYSKVDLWTVDCLGQLIGTVDAILTSKSFMPYGGWDKKDEKIFKGYSFHHSINCKQCGRAVKTTRQSLLKHLNEHDPKKECTSKIELIEEILDIALGRTRKTEHGNDPRALPSSEPARPKRNTSSQSCSTNTTVGSNENRLKQVNNTKTLNELKPNKESTSKKRRGGRGKKTKNGNVPELLPQCSLTPSKRDFSSQSSSTNNIASKENQPKQVINTKKLNDFNPKKESTTAKKGSDNSLGIALGRTKKIENGNVPGTLPQCSLMPSKRNTSSQSSSTNTIASEENQPKQVINTNKQNELNPEKESTTAKKGFDNSLGIALGRTKKIENAPSKRDTSSQSSSTNTTIASKEDHPKQVDGPKIKTTQQINAAQNPNKKKRDEPKRKIHRPIRLVDGEYVTVGSIPKTKVELTKKTRKFINNASPQTHIMIDAVRRKEFVNSPAHDNMVEALKLAFKSSYPKVQAYPFGSRITGLGNESSDLDIYLDLEGNYDGSRKYSKDKLKWCVLLTEEILKLTDQWNKLEPVTSARTPILRAWNTKEKIDCDISFTHGLSHCNTKLIQYLFDLQPVCYYVALYAKDWSRNFSMDGLNTYTLVLLTIFYFQKHNLLPCIHNLQQGCKDPMFITHWQANFERKSLNELRIPQIPETDTEKYIKKFFSYYGSRFCFETRVVCPFLGWAPQKEDFDPYDCEIPLEMENLQNYYSKIDMKLAHPVNDLLSYMKPMVVQDPFELNHNVAKGVAPNDVNRFRQYCAQTGTLLDEILNEMV